MHPCTLLGPCSCSLVPVAGEGRRARGAGPTASMLFNSMFKTLVGKTVTVELKNDLCISGTLQSVDQFLNIKMTDISVQDAAKYPHMLSVKNCFIRGSVVRYIQLPPEHIDTSLLQDAARREATEKKAAAEGASK